MYLLIYVLKNGGWVKMPVWSLDLNKQLIYLIFEIISDIKVVLDVLLRHFTL